MRPGCRVSGMVQLKRCWMREEGSCSLLVRPTEPRSSTGSGESLEHGVRSGDKLLLINAYLPGEEGWETPSPISTTGPERLRWLETACATGSRGSGAPLMRQAVRSGLLVNTLGPHRESASKMVFRFLEGPRGWVYSDGAATSFLHSDPRIRETGFL